MSIENEIADLTIATTDLLDAVNVKKSALDDAVSDAETAKDQAQTAVTDATSQVSLAAAEKVGAQTARDTAESFKDQAYTYSQSAASAVAYQDLTAIAQTKSETAVDVFVYDTRKDSDGGAWRKRTQHTSWYNETLNTATRGSRKEFPAVAVIVAEANKVTIYDGDDPSMPMWMVFPSTTSTTSHKGVLRSLNSYNVTCISMRNGKLCVGINISGSWAGNEGLNYVNFPKDEAGKYNSHASYNGTVTPITAYKDTDVTYDPSLGTLVSNDINDVAMTVLPDAPIDPATGLPIPTIAVATDGGVSVIKDDGNVVDSSSTSAKALVAFTEDSYLLATNKTTANIFLYGYKDNWVDGFGAKIYSSSYGYPMLPASYQDDGLTGVKNNLHSGSTKGLASILWENSDIVYDNQGVLFGSMARITSTYNTGWMNGDIKLATLSDTDDTDLVGSELVTNGTFDTDTSGWATTGATTTISVENGRLKSVRDNTGAWGAPYYAFASTVGKTYQVTMTIEADANNSNTVYLRGSSSSNPTSPGIHDTSKFSYTVLVGQTITTTQYFTATNVYSFVHVMGNVEDTWYIDNVSITEVEPDRSVNNNGLQVFGTVQKSPVATGADLVAYGPFSGSNYLQQPYNSDLDFGTGDFCVMGWLNTTDSYGIILDRNSPSGGSFGGISIGTYPRAVNGLDFSVQNNFNLSSTVAVNTGSWVSFACLRRSGIVEMWINGELNNTVASTTDINSGSANPTTKFGVRHDGAQTLEGHIALLRISATAPTAEQIKKIYEDEKVLFQENAKATLHGTSDAVKALAYDDTTELLHVGTSAGRSVFQGLRRVDNTTDAVGTAISASNNLVVEE